VLAQTTGYTLGALDGLVQLAGPCDETPSVLDLSIAKRNRSRLQCPIAVAEGTLGARVLRRHDRRTMGPATATRKWQMR